MDLLTAQLDEYNKHGVPKLANVHLQCDVTINEEGRRFLLLPFNFSFLFLFRVSFEIRDLKSWRWFRIKLTQSMRSSLKKHLYLVEEHLNPFLSSAPSCYMQTESAKFEDPFNDYSTKNSRVTYSYVMLFSFLEETFSFECENAIESESGRD